jgi:hypothetical protein
MLLNFFLDQCIHLFAGVDLSQFYPEELNKIKKVLWEWWNLVPWGSFLAPMLLSRLTLGWRNIYFVTGRTKTMYFTGTP